MVWLQAIRFVEVVEFHSSSLQGNEVKTIKSNFKNTARSSIILKLYQICIYLPIVQFVETANWCQIVGESAQQRLMCLEEVCGEVSVTRGELFYSTGGGKGGLCRCCVWGNRARYENE